MSEAEWREFYQRKVEAMIAAGNAYLAAGGTDEGELEKAIAGAWPDCSGAAYQQARVRVGKIGRGGQ